MLFLSSINFGRWVLSALVTFAVAAVAAIPVADVPLVVGDA